jgi:exosortase A
MPRDAGTTGEQAIDAGWRLALPLVVVALVATLAIHWSTAASIVAIWDRSETFAHGFLIVPIVLFLIWRRRHEVSRLTPRADWLGFALVGAAGAAWLVAYAGEVLVVKQLALAATLCAVVIAVLGRNVARALTFPLCFLFLGVPMGEALIPPLMEWTADFTVAALQSVGIPVFREGLFFTIPSGQWSVVEGCSGVRYLIASFTVGVLFAYLSYRRPWKRALFALMSILVPIVANGLRAFMIVMIAHVSDNKLAHGVDHFIYGWVFFGLVMLLLFWIGSFWRDDDDPEDDVAKPPRRGDAMPDPVLARWALASVALVAAWPGYAAYLDRQDERRGTSVAIDAPVPINGWSLDPSPMTEWRPRYDPATATVLQVYRKGDSVVALQLNYYQRQRRGEQLVSSQNIMIVQKHKVWQNVGETIVSAAVGNSPNEVRETRLMSPRQRLLIWDWFRIAGHDMINPYLAKVMLALEKLANRGDAGTAIIIATPYMDQSLPPRETLQAFVRDMTPSIDAALRRTGTDMVASGAPSR